MGDKVMFTAVADRGGYYGPFTSDRTLVFNTAITNIGGNYDPTSGIFTAPAQGYYYFTFFYHASKQHKTGLNLIKNHDLIISSFDDKIGTSTIIDNAGNAATLQLEAGDKVFVQLPAECHVYAADSVTTFSGFLIGGA
ncbi:C1q-related factor-like [Antennarius striatus]|uniref:C1q-related factor-like n=1 Tax=Antennarius striatus TaxID=241820 RepID=UPI0035B2AB87